MKPYRLEKLASEVRDVVGEAIVHRLADPRISPLTSVTRVIVSADLSYADVYISVLGEESDRRRTMSGLQHARGHVQSLVARHLCVRQCPHLRFHLDESIRRGNETIRLIEEMTGRTGGTAAGTGPDSDGENA